MQWFAAVFGFLFLCLIGVMLAFVAGAMPS